MNLTTHRVVGLLVLAVIALCVTGAAAEFKQKTISQRSGHFDWANNATFSQRYAINDEFFVKEKPIFILHLSNFYYPTYYMDKSGLYEWARSLGAALVHFELRYNGASWPVANLTTENLRYQTVEQHFADIIALQEHIERDYGVAKQTNGGEDHDWVMAGSIFGGFIATAFRSRFPHRTLGVVGVRPAIRIESHVTGFDEKYHDIAGPQCAPIIQKLVLNLTDVVKNDRSIQPTFGCPADQDSSQFLYVVAQIVQFGLDSMHDDFCGNLTASPTLPRLAHLVHTLLNNSGVPCLDWDMALDNDTTPGHPGASFRPYLYMQCTQLGQFETAGMVNGTKGLMSPVLNLEWFLSICHDLFGLDPAHLVRSIHYHGDFYGGGRGNYLHVENSILVVSPSDPLSSLALDSSRLKGAQQIVTLPSTVNPEDVLGSYNSETKNEVTKSQHLVSKELRRWFQESKTKTINKKTLYLTSALSIVSVLLVVSLAFSIYIYRVYKRQGVHAYSSVQQQDTWNQ